jgi:threonine dehydrogenase-like Zn-dependent dehydrogenase
VDRIEEEPADVDRGEVNSAAAPVRTVVIGCGDISTVHLAAIADLDGVELVGVCDVNEERAAKVAAAHGVPAFLDHRQILAGLSRTWLTSALPTTGTLPWRLTASLQAYTSSSRSPSRTR